MALLSFSSRRRMGSCACASTIGPLTRSPRRTDFPSPSLTTSLTDSKVHKSLPRSTFVGDTIRSASTKMTSRKQLFAQDMAIINTKSCPLDSQMRQLPLALVQDILKPLLDICVIVYI